MEAALLLNSPLALAAGAVHRRPASEAGRNAQDVGFTLQSTTIRARFTPTAARRPASRRRVQRRTARGGGPRSPGLAARCRLTPDEGLRPRALSLPGRGTPLDTLRPLATCGFCRGGAPRRAGIAISFHALRGTGAICSGLAGRADDRAPFSSRPPGTRSLGVGHQSTPTRSYRRRERFATSPEGGHIPSRSAGVGVRPFNGRTRPRLSAAPGWPWRMEPNREFPRPSPCRRRGADCGMAMGAQPGRLPHRPLIVILTPTNVALRHVGAMSIPNGSRRPCYTHGQASLADPTAFRSSVDSYTISPRRAAREESPRPARSRGLGFRYWALQASIPHCCPRCARRQRDKPV